MKVALICVNYNSTSDLVRYLKSIRQAEGRVDELSLSIFVADNSTGNFKIDLNSLIDFKVETKNLKIENYENIGYFPAASRIWNDCLVERMNYDYVIVSNVDLELSENFFEDLKAIPSDFSTGVLAPAVISRRGSDLNPKILNRPEKIQLKKNKFIFDKLLLYVLYVGASNLKYKFLGRSKKSSAAREIYAPHGAIVIFTNSYIRCAKSIDYPVFLYGEEIFVAEECRRNNLKVRYEPGLQVSDFDHGATSMQGAGFRATEHAKSIDYLLKTYF
ncbi:GT2 family glycosyltransferase [Variovorax boronicumulans]|uniref:glycosyltransferase family 2 protein n=1 Tax=Variovorax boronicumulans TaxID=436515 RepID=UPI0033970A07